MKNTLILILFFIFTFSCKNKNENNKPFNSLESNIYCINVNSFPENNSLYLQAYSSGTCKSFSAEIEGENIFFGYNKKLHSIDIINLSKKRPLKQILLSKDGPNSVGLLVVGIAYYGGSILVDDSYYYYKIDFEGKILSKISKNDLLGSLIKDYTFNKVMPIMWMGYRFLLIDPVKGEFAVTLYPLNNSDISLPLYVAVISVDSWKVTSLIKVPFPDFIKREGDMYELNVLNAILVNNKMVYNYPASSKIFVYDRITKDLNVIDFEPKLSKSFNKPIDKFGVDKSRASMFLGYYYPLYYDVYRDVYWRLNVGEINERGKYLDRSYVLSRISGNFLEYKEIELPTDLLDSEVIIMKDRVLFGFNEWCNKLTPDSIMFYSINPI